jgi:hypothetical protein
MQCNVNKMFGDKKIHEIKNEEINDKFKKPPKKENISGEIINDKITIFNEIDGLNM